jgi:hypothetical protein
MTESATWPDVERRSEPRLRTLLTGRIQFDNHTSTMDCTIRSLSAHGGRVVLSEAFRLPESFNLTVPHHNQTHRAKIIWRRAESAGLALTDIEAPEHPQHHRKTPREIERARRKEMADARW